MMAAKIEKFDNSSSTTSPHRVSTQAKFVTILVKFVKDLRKSLKLQITDL